MKNYLRKIEWPHTVRLLIWYVAMQGVWVFLDIFLEPIIGYWPGFALGIIFAVLTLKWWFANEDNSSQHQGRFWWVWWNAEDARIWKGMTKPERAICSAYRVPPSLVGARRTQGPQKG